MTRRRLRALQTLQWRLALSYVLVCVVAMATMTVATVAFAAFTFRPNPVSAPYPDKGVIQSMSYGVAPYLAPYLEPTRPDVLDLRGQLVHLLQPVPKDRLAAQPAPYEQVDLLVVVGRNHTVLASAESSSLQSATGLQRLPPLQSLPALLGNRPVVSALQQAWTGDQTSERLVAALPAGYQAVANPLLDFNDQVIGVVVGVFAPVSDTFSTETLQNAQQASIATALGQLLPGMLVFILGAGVLGILAGVLFTRGLTRRLLKIASAAHQWSKGELSVAIHDNTGDEIGRLSRDLDVMAGHLKDLVTARQELAVVSERHRLARDLHDSIKQQLFVMTMLIGAAHASVADQPEVRAMLQDVEGLARQTHAELTSLIRALRPVALAGGRSLGAALRTLVESWSRTSGIAADTEIDDGLRSIPAVEEALFGVAQEALANIARHSGASRLSVRLGGHPGALRLAISDNGHGFDVLSPRRTGVGLAGMHERMADVGGSLSVSSGPGGSHVEAQCPTAESWGKNGSSA